MANFHATAIGDIPFTAEEEIAWAAAQAAAETAKPAQDRALAWEAIKAERDRRKWAGVKVGAKWFHSDDTSRIQQIGLVMMGAGIPPGLQWKTMDGTFVTMTQALAGQVFGAVAAADQALFARAELHRVAMEASADPLGYDVTTDWPATFDEWAAA